MEEWLVRSLAREYASYWSRCQACGRLTRKEGRHEYRRMVDERTRVVALISAEGYDDRVRGWFFDEAEKSYGRYAFSRSRF